VVGAADGCDVQVAGFAALGRGPPLAGSSEQGHVAKELAMKIMLAALGLAIPLAGACIGEGPPSLSADAGGDGSVQEGRRNDADVRRNDADVSVGGFPGGLPAGQVIAYLDARTLGLKDGAAVPVFFDLSPNGYSFSEANAARQPRFQASGLNGRPAVEFDGVDDRLVLAPVANPHKEPYVIYLVFQLVNNNGSDQVFTSAAPDVGIGGKLVFGVATGNRYVVRNCPLVGQQGHFYGGVPDTEPHLARKDHEVDDRLFIDNMTMPVIAYKDATITTSSCGGNTNPFRDMSLGLRENGERPAHYRLGALLVVDGPTPGQKAAIEADLKTAWGLP
jgi:hypothetical protein